LRHHAAALTGHSPEPAGAAPEPIVFSTADAERWAAFSGDRNPIHFDIEQARLLDADRLVVHGMVALLPIRRRIAQRSAPRGGDGWRRLRVMFRLPVPQDIELALTAKDDGTSVRFGLRPAGDSQEHIRAHYAPDEPPPILSTGPPSPVPSERIEAFVAAYGAAFPGWMALEAAVFAELVQSDTDPIWEIVERHARAAWGELTGRPMVVHASHIVSHGAQDSLHASAARFAPGAVAYATGPVSVDSVSNEARKSLSCRIPLAVTVAGERVLQIEVGLLVIEAAGRR
jgi:MaoC like domain